MVLGNLSLDQEVLFSVKHKHFVRLSILLWLRIPKFAPITFLLCLLDELYLQILNPTVTTAPQWLKSV